MDTGMLTQSLSTSLSLSLSLSTLRLRAMRGVMAVDAAWQFAFHFVHLSIHPPVRELHYFLEHFSEVDITCVTADLITGAQDGDEKDGRLHHAMMLWWAE